MSAPLGPATGTWRGDGFVHESFVYDSAAQLAARCVPFVQEGLDRGQPVFVVAGEASIQALRDGLGRDLDRLELLAPADAWWAGGHGTLLRYFRGMRDIAAERSPARVLAEPTWVAHPHGQVWYRYEAVVNAVFGSMPVYILCPYDRSLLGPGELDILLRTHPVTWDGVAPVPSPSYEDPATFLRSVAPEWTTRPAAAAGERFVSVAAARGFVSEATATIGGQRGGEMTLAVHELVANAVEAAGAAEVRCWFEDGQMVWEVSDDGPGLQDPTAGYTPPADDDDGGRGLWIARSLADDCTVRPGGSGTAIRLYFLT